MLRKTIMALVALGAISLLAPTEVRLARVSAAVVSAGAGFMAGAGTAADGAGADGAALMRPSAQITSRNSALNPVGGIVSEPDGLTAFAGSATRSLKCHDLTIQVAQALRRAKRPRALVFVRAADF